MWERGEGRKIERKGKQTRESRNERWLVTGEKERLSIRQKGGKGVRVNRRFLLAKLPLDVIKFNEEQSKRRIRFFVSVFSQRYWQMHWRVKLI